MIAAVSSQGIGEYQVPDKYKNFKAFQSAKKTHYLIVEILLGICAVGLTIAITFLGSFAPLAFLAYAPITYFAVKSLTKHIALSRLHAPLNEEKIDEDTKLCDIPRLCLGQFHGISADQGYNVALTKHGKHSFEAKLKLIEKAKKSIVLTGNCFGGQAFEKALEKIKKGLEEKEDLKVFILVDFLRLDKKHLQKMKEIRKEFCERFTMVQAPSYALHYQVEKSKAQHASQNVNALVIDYGHMAIIGNSCLHDMYSNYEGKKDEKVRKKGTPFFDDPIQTMSAAASLSTDVIISDPTKGKGIGFLLHIELCKIIAKMQRFSKKTMTALQHIPKDASNVLGDVDYVFTDIVEDVRKANVAVFAKGSLTNSSSAFIQKLIALIEDTNPGETIYINHKGMRLTEDLQKALMRASSRNVKVKIITNGKGKKSPGSHLSISSKKLKRLKADIFEAEIHLLKRDHITIDRQMVIIGNKYVAIGSNNLSKKSLEQDININVILESEDFARNAIELFESDLQLCEKFEK